MKIGLKLYSTDVALISDARELKAKEFFDFVELYVIPGSYGNTIGNWKSFDVPYVIHAPHSYHGINFARAGQLEANLKNIGETQLFANTLGVDIIIAHGGNNGSFDETLRQISLLDDNRIVLENKPKIGLSYEVCVGCTPSEFQHGIERGVLKGIALDFGHASCAARSLGINAMEIIRDFMIFKPKIFHLSDGDTLSERDIHLNLGRGDLDLAEFVSVIPEDSLITIETPRNPSNTFDDFIEDVFFLRKILSEKGAY